MITFLITNHSAKVITVRFFLVLRARLTAFEELNLFHHNKRLLRILGSVIFTSSNFIFAELSDLHQNSSTGWHRDTKDYLFKERGNGRWARSVERWLPYHQSMPLVAVPWFEWFWNVFQTWFTSPRKWKPRYIVCRNEIHWFCIHGKRLLKNQHICKPMEQTDNS